MKGSSVSRLWANTRLIKREYSSHTSIPPAAVSNFTFSGTETIGLLKAPLSSGSIEKLSANIFISSYTRLSCSLSFAREKSALAYREEIVPISIPYDLLNDTSSSSRSIICRCSLSRPIFSFITFSAIAIDRSAISERTSRIAFSFLRGYAG